MPTFEADPSSTYTYTPDVQVTVELYGAGGGDGASGEPGGTGGYASIDVAAGTTLEIAVGEGGSTPDAGQSPAGDGGDGASGSFNRAAGGGGGATTVTRQSDGVEIAAVGAGGGGGSDHGTSLTYGGGGGARGGVGGSAGTDGEAADGTGVGGDGGDVTSGGAQSGDDGGTLTDGGVTVNATQTGGGNTGDAVVEVIIPPPDAPTGVGQTVTGDDAVDVSWDDIGTAAEYDVEVAEDGGGWQSVMTTSQTSITYSAAPATNAHQFRVRSVNDGGSSDWAYTETKATDPSGLTASGDAFAPIALSWDAAPDASEYRILRATASGSVAGDYTQIATTGSTTYDDDADPVQTYYYRIQAVYPGTDSQVSNEASALRWEPPAVDGLDASTAREIGVSWSLQDDSSDGSVEIYRSTDGSLGSLVNTIADLSTTQWTDTGLQDGTTVHYTLRRVVDDQSADSDQQSATTILPAPTELDAVDVRDTEADVEWTATHDNGETRVEVREDDDGDWSVDQAVSYDTEQATIEGLLNGQLYGVRVVADTGDAEEVDQ